MAAGCATVPPATPAAPVAVSGARLAIVNLTDYEWHIVITSATGGEHREAPVPARGSLSLDLAGGDYVIEQAVTSGVATQTMARRIPARLEAGRTYRWRLDTLLSDASGDPARSQP